MIDFLKNAGFMISGSNMGHNSIQALEISVKESPSKMSTNSRQRLFDSKMSTNSRQRLFDPEEQSADRAFWQGNFDVLET